ncbi:mycofactocin-coupled SDR family oxidoreductase [Streptomyces sp. NPDC049099]|uniref:mycofactocin-coupled SDR family oxidoreductase n=1 Tax=unclassified Streptomyces TaxID=2593676 RepID=UPI0034252902
MGKFDGKVVLVTGAARGQGRSHAVRFAREGADVAVLDVAAQVGSVPYAMPGADDLDETVKLVENLGRRCVSGRVDVRDAERLGSFVAQVEEELGGVDFLLANAGVFSFSTIAEMPDQTWRDMVDVNLTGAFHSIRAVLPGMIARGRGRIVATSSMAGKMGMANVGHYAATKWGLIGLVKSVATEVGQYGITANVVCTGAVDTPMINNPSSLKLFLPHLDNPSREEVVQAFSQFNTIPKAWAECEDISNTMVFLCSEEARFITGETIAVALGQNASNAT